MILAYPVKQHIIVAFENEVKKATIIIKDVNGNFIDEMEVEKNDFVKIDIDHSYTKIKLEINIGGQISKKEIILT